MCEPKGHQGLKEKCDDLDFNFNPLAFTNDPEDLDYFSDEKETGFLHRTGMDKFRHVIMTGICNQMSSDLLMN